MYKGRTYCSDEKGNHEQVKRLPDDDFVDWLERLDAFFLSFSSPRDVEKV